MKNNKGFTLVELLAVIVILAVILVIAIPNVMKIIDKARLDAYKRNEDMLISAAQKYMAQNGITLSTVGQTITITYSDLKTNNLIANINDQTDNNTSTKECANSKAIVTKTTNGYGYKPGLVCTNYISLDTFNLLSNPNFIDGTITGWGSDGSASTNVIDGVVRLTGTGVGSNPQMPHIHQSKTVSNNGKIYGSFTFNAITANSNFLRLYNNGFVSVKDLNNYVTNNWYVISAIYNAIGTTTFLGAGIVYSDANSAIGKIVELKNPILLDLTAIYGTGNEPTQNQMDNLINKSR
jgi:type IV pilus assembly protein PilA